MSGLIFLKCKDLPKVRAFYLNTVEMEVWLEQPRISILRHGNFLIGFHDTGEIDDGCLLTFYYETNEEVDAMYQKLKDTASFAPKVNDKYNIYHFFAKDPEGRNIEFQRFLQPVSGDWS
ncbi:MAG: VOC family protein [Candidatus Thermoplasmatota archaeon]|nr:VOC family protein [Euryarchaeota archaeon]MBU4071364.1 VOC family protein [Candidatus Thermoplasmatota archaeon]MBU4143804.1 VOC family protein [Candidatus Thermoplasmatota archaeon]MBU4592462.1 VOC family protein [Candidatus Thermoplasmatota archaeon]